MNKTTELASGYTVQMYEADIKELDRTLPSNDAAIKAKIADFFVRRFTERYITPINAAPKGQKNGFCTMAVSCLMVEALQCFWTGKKDTRGWDNSVGKSKGQVAFDDFFDRSTGLKMFKGTSFYSDIRCGILHQAETNKGWKINRQNANGKVLDRRSIDATKFHKLVEGVLNEHATRLKTEAKTSEVWDHFRKKMKHVCDNC